MATRAEITLDELTSKIGVDPDALNAPCSHEHLNEISLFLTDWQTVAPHLGLEERDEVDIQREGMSEDERRLKKTLRRWKNRFTSSATYEKLVTVFLKLGLTEQAEKVCRLLPNKGTYVQGH